MWELDHKESWLLKNWCFWTVVLEKTLESPLDWRRSNQSILKEISLEYSLEELILKLKLQYFGHLMRRTDPLEKTLKGMKEDEMAGWHHWFDGHEFEWTPGVGDGQGGLVCCNSWGCKESDTTERLPFHFSLSCIGEGNGNPLQCSCLENPMVRGAWQATILAGLQRVRGAWQATILAGLQRVTHNLEAKLLPPYFYFTNSLRD